MEKCKLDCVCFRFLGSADVKMVFGKKMLRYMTQGLSNSIHGRSKKIQSPKRVQKIGIVVWAEIFQ